MFRFVSSIVITVLALFTFAVASYNSMPEFDAWEMEKAEIAYESVMQAYNNNVRFVYLHGGEINKGDAVRLMKIADEAHYHLGAYVGDDVKMVDGELVISYNKAVYDGMVSLRGQIGRGF